jgi:hypothetical protein
MKRNQLLLTVIAACLITLTSFLSAEKNPKEKNSDEGIPYPEGYRDWTHVKTHIVRPHNPAFKIVGGFNHVYANKEAMIGFRTGKFPNGSVIVSDVVKVNEDSLATVEAERIHIDVMMRDSLKYNDFGGWRFETFDKNTANRMLTLDARNACSNCHRKTPDMVFGNFRK